MLSECDNALSRTNNNIFLFPLLIMIKIMGSYIMGWPLGVTNQNNLNVTCRHSRLRLRKYVFLIIFELITRILVNLILILCLIVSLIIHYYYETCERGIYNIDMEMWFFFSNSVVFSFFNIVCSQIQTCYFLTYSWKFLYTL